MSSLIKIHFSLIALLAAGCSSAEPTRLSSVLSGMDRYRGTTIEMEACLISNTHGMALVDCSDDSAGLSFEFDQGVESTPKARELLDAGYKNWAPGGKAKIHVVTTGRLIPAADQRAGVKFIIHDVRRVEVAK